MSYSATVLADVPLYYYRLGDASGTSVADSSGNSKTGTLTGTVGRVTGLLVGDSNGCFDFDGSTTWVDTPTVGVQTAITADALISMDGNNKVQIIQARADEATGGAWIQFILRVNSANKAEFSARKGGAWVTATGTTTLAIGTTYHIAGTADGSSVKIYVNGALETTVSDANALNSITSALAGLIGAGWNGAQYAKFDGKIDEVAFYATALSSTRIAAHYAAAVSGDASVAPPAATATASAPTPVISGGSTVAPPVATATASAPVPVITSGTNATVAPPAATATAMAPVPTITQVIPAGTDTTNFLNGRNRRARASVTVIRPVASPPSNLAPRQDKAVPLPPPTLVDGRVV